MRKVSRFVMLLQDKNELYDITIIFGLNLKFTQEETLQIMAMKE
jgi:hypothetical protein